MRNILIFGLVLVFSYITVNGQITNNQSLDKDSGVDFVVVKNENVNLRGLASTTSQIVTLIQKKERLILLNRQNDNGFYLVGDITRSVKGWIYKDFIEIWLTNEKNESVAKNQTEANLLPCPEPQYLATNDQGMDIVKVNNNGLSLLSSNESVSFVLKQLSTKDNLVFISKTSDNKGYEVIDTETNLKGWVSCLETKVFLTKKAKQNLEIQENKSDKTNQPPTVKIENQNNEELTIWLNEEKHTLAPLTDKLITLQTGTSRFLAKFPQTNPIIGTKTLQNGVVYSIKFN